MIKPLYLLGLSGLVALLSGCGSKPHPELYEPGDIPAWRTVETQAANQQTVNRPMVRLETSMGSIVIELFAEQAPVSTENFLRYVREGHYDGTIFHRVIPGFMVQGGGFSPGLEEKPTREPIENEADNGVRNNRGTVAMARTNDPDSATAQFYINLVDNAFLNNDGSNPGYAVFGYVSSGMDVVDRIAFVETEGRGGMNDVPVEPVVIHSAAVVREP